MKGNQMIVGRTNELARGATQAVTVFLLSAFTIAIGACNHQEKHPPAATQQKPAGSESKTPTPVAASSPKTSTAATSTSVPPPPPGHKIEAIEEKWENRNIKSREEGYYESDGNFVLHGPSTQYYESGKKKTEIFYRNNEVHGPRTAWREDGKIHTQGENYEGKPNGTWMQYFADGKPALEMHYDHGKFHGTFIEYHTNGQKRKQSEWVDGKEMNVRVWDETGRELFVVPEGDKKAASSGGH